MPIAATVALGWITFAPALLRLSRDPRLGTGTVGESGDAAEPATV